MILTRQLHYILFVLASIFIEIKLICNEVDKFCIEQNLSFIPLQEREKLFALFDDLFKQHEFSYTLYGNKPASIIDYYLDSFKENCLIDYCHDILEKNRPINHYVEGWEIWEKYKNLFKLNNYIFTNYYFQSSNKSIIIVLINKKTFLKTIEDNLSIFKAILKNTELKPQDLLFKLENGNTLFDIIKDNQELLGILLGFGNHNARLFKKRDKIQKILQKKQKIFGLIKASNFKQLQSLEINLKHLNRKLQFFNPYGMLPMSVNFPSFLAELNHPDSINLKNEYAKDRKKISKIYNEANWFKEILHELTSAKAIP